LTTFSAPFAAGEDISLAVWAKAMAQGWIDFPDRAQVLEIGCAEADWQTPMLALRPDLQITGIDWRDCVRPGNLIRGDVMNWRLFNERTFDAIVSISAIEHVGLGAYDDPQDPSGDSAAMHNAYLWLKPNGWMYLDVPYCAQGYEVLKKHRRYDDQALEERLCQDFAVRHHVIAEVEHPDGPYMALLLVKS